MNAIRAVALKAHPAGNYAFVYIARLECKWFTTWDGVRIGDASYLFPIRSQLVAVYSDAVPASDRIMRVTREYIDYRHFEASSKITFH